jgi:RimJ/RimL family protein N-acetyltransferase
MSWTLTPDPGAFLDAAGDFLLADPVRHTIQLSVIETLRARGTYFGGRVPLFGWWRPAGAGVTAVVLHTPPYPVLLTELPSGAAGPLAAELAARGAAPAGVNALEGDAHEFATAWRACTGGAARVHERSRLYRLVELTPPSPWPQGTAQIAGSADRDLLVSWFAAFTAEVGGIGAAGVVDDRIGYGGLTLWQNDGVPVAMAGITRRAADMIRVAPVYTPPEHRRHGYAAAVTATVSRAALEAAAHVVLFTNPANPTSNALYLRLGYQPVEDRVVLRFHT